MARLVQSATTVRNETKRVVVWIDSAAASVVHVPLNEPGGEAASLAQLPRLLAKRPDDAAKGHVRRAAKDFYRKVRRELKGAKHILIVGPSTTKLDFLRFIGKRSPSMESRVIGIETLEDGSDEILRAYATRYFGRSKAA